MRWQQHRHSQQQRDRDEIVRVMCAVLSAFVFLMFFATTTRAAQPTNPTIEMESTQLSARSLFSAE